jgi:O-methyltransferase
MIYQFARQACLIDGDAAEVGVYKGGTARLIAKVLAETRKKVHIFDTFAGMPPTDATKDFVREGDFSDSSLERVKEYLKDCDNIKIHPGFFPDTSTPVADTTFSFVYVDVDAYRSVIDCCKFFYGRMERGGIMLFDDYGFLTCEGARLAVDEFFSNMREKPCYLPTGQCVVFRV